jgi:hypothetical protein
MGDKGAVKMLIDAGAHISPKSSGWRAELGEARRSHQDKIGGMLVKAILKQEKAKGIERPAKEALKKQLEEAHLPQDMINEILSYFKGDKKP